MGMLGLGSGSGLGRVRGYSFIRPEESPNKANKDRKTRMCVCGVCVCVLCSGLMRQRVCLSVVLNNMFPS